MVELEESLSPEAPRSELFKRLKPRQREILQSICDGNSNSATAAKLGISIKTVEADIHNITHDLPIDSQPTNHAIKLSQIIRDAITSGDLQHTIDLNIPVFVTPRERKYVDLLLEGNTVKEIASAMSISIKTVETHSAHTNLKLNTKSRWHKIARAAYLIKEDQLLVGSNLMKKGFQYVLPAFESRTSNPAISPNKIISEN